MSTDAKRWAARQRGLRPAQERILRVLADFHTFERGCFPSQKRLSDVTGISVSALNSNLAALEALGLIARKRRRTANGTQRTTEYALHLDIVLDDQPKPKRRAKPTPESGNSRLRNRETSQYQESLNPDLLHSAERLEPQTGPLSPVERVLAAAGPGLSQNARKVIRTTDHILQGWLDQGVSLEDVIIPIVRARTRRIRRQEIETWRYFEAAVLEADTEIPKDRSFREKARSGDTPEIPLPADPASATRPIPEDLQASRARNPLVQQSLAAVARAKKW